jgi:arylsulfatase A-like enzyme
LGFAKELNFVDMKKPNVLWISIDCFGTDKLLRSLPSLSFFKKMKAKGVFFDNMFSSTSSTTPSLATVLTGLYPQKHGILSTYGHELTAQTQTVADLLKGQGYQCSASVSGPLHPKTRLSSGFDQYNFYKPMKTFKFSRWQIQFKQMDAIDKKVIKDLKTVTQKAGQWFHWIHLLDLHNRWRHKNKGANTQYEGAILKLNSLLEVMYEMIDFSNTIVFIVADHGHYVAELDGPLDGINYEEAHGFHVYDLITRVPFIAYSPLQLGQNQQISTPTSTTDILPTLLNLLDIERSKSLAGQSLLPLLQGVSTLQKYTEKPIFLQACGAILKKQGAPFLYSIRKNGWKLVTTLEESKFKPQLFNLLDDPNEKANVIDQHQELKNELMVLIKERVIETN